MVAIFQEKLPPNDSHILYETPTQWQDFMWNLHLMIARFHVKPPINDSKISCETPT